MDRLTWGEMARGGAELVQVNLRIALHRKLWIVVGGIVAYYGLLYIMALVRPGAGLAVAEALHTLVEIPGMVLAIYLVMDQVAVERDGETLELLYTVSASHYAVWLVRMVSVYAVLCGTLMVMSVLAYYLFAEFPMVLGGLNACLPALLLANVTLCLAAWCRSANTAGMLATGVALLALMVGSELEGSVWSPFLNPMEPPIGTDVYSWPETVAINRGSVGGLSILLLIVALRMMGNREKLLT